jgi:hypothetical protein
MVLLGEVLIGDGRPTSAASAFRDAQRRLAKTQLTPPDVVRDLDRRIANGLMTARQRWDQFRSGVAGHCLIVARFRGALDGLQLQSAWSELDLERTEEPTSAGETLLLFERTTAAGPHAITLHATYLDRVRIGYRYDLEVTQHRSCQDGERIEMAFETVGSNGTAPTVNTVATGGKPLPQSGPLRPNPLF